MSTKAFLTEPRVGKLASTWIVSSVPAYVRRIVVLFFSSARTNSRETDEMHEIMNEMCIFNDNFECFLYKLLKIC